MSKPTRPATKEVQDKIELEVPPIEPNHNAPSPQSKIDEFVKRREEVAARDHAKFQDYLRDKEEKTARKGELVPAAAVEEKRKSRMSRRTMLNIGVGTAAVAEAAVLGNHILGSGSVSDHGINHASGTYT